MDSAPEDLFDRLLAQERAIGKLEYENEQLRKQLEAARLALFELEQRRG